MRIHAKHAVASLRELEQEARQLMRPSEDSLIVFRSREALWLEKKVIGREKNELDNFL